MFKIYSSFDLLKKVKGYARSMVKFKIQSNL